MRARNVIATIARAAAWCGLALYGYAAAGLVGGAVPTNRDWRPPAQGIRIFVQTNGVHVGIVVPKVAGGEGWRVDWRPVLKPGDIRDPRYAGYDHAGFGWGDAGFYLNTPTWRAVRPGPVIAAALGSERTLLHVDHVPAPTPGDDVRAIMLTPDQYRRLTAYLRAGFAVRPGSRPGYGANDAFYDARGRYSAARTCNAWVGDALRHAGVRVGAWTPFAATVLWWF